LPLYRYKCKNCGYEFTILHSMNETPDVKCELCGSEVEKMISNVGISFKGDGFYITDSKKSKSKPSSSSSSKESDQLAS